MKTLAVLALLSGTAHAEQKERDPSALRMIVLAGAMTTYIVTDYVVEHHIAPEGCRWCTPPRLDASIRQRLVWDDRRTATLTSDMTAFVLTPLVSGGVLALSARGADCPSRRFYRDIIPVVEAGLYTHLFTQAVKYSVGRQRPALHFDGTNDPSPEDNLSFFSGHTALAFSIGVSSALVARRRGYKTAETALWISTAVLGGATAYLRMGADRHYFSDVLLGALVGATGGFVIPTLGKRLSERATLVPAPNGLALVGQL